MKLIHLSDLHLGKRVNEFNMLEDQEYILTKILNVIDEEKPDAVLIAGDIYDKAVPSAEAVQLFDDFLCRLQAKCPQIFVISGNHDSPERIAFASRLIEASGVHLSPVYNGHIEPHVLHDEYGEVLIYMLPFVRPSHVRHALEAASDEQIVTYTDAIRAALRQAGPDPEKRCVLVAHQFVTGASRTESEDISVGGLDNVDASVFAGFDYVALGHIHRAQFISAGEKPQETEACAEEAADRGVAGKENESTMAASTPVIRYCGTPLKYSFSEAKDEKTVTIVELGKKGEVSVRTAPLTPKREMREIRGTYEQLMTKENYEGTQTDDYLHITLTDENDIADAVSRLRVVYPNLMKLDYDNQRTRTTGIIDGAADAERRTPLDLLEELFEKQNGHPLSDDQRELSNSLISKIWDEETT